MSDKECISSKIWQEIPTANNPYLAQKCVCSGYDVYGELLAKASWFDYVLLLFTLEKPAPWQSSLLHKLAIAIANPGPRDHSIRAAMNAGVGGSTSAACLSAALAVGAGQLNGAREVFNCMQIWKSSGLNLDHWQNYIANPPQQVITDIWEPSDHLPGFDPYASECSPIVVETLHQLAVVSNGVHLCWLLDNRLALEHLADLPLAMACIAAATFLDLGLNDEQAEMLYLMLRLPGAAVHALEQRQYGWRRYPFFHNGLEIENDPGELLPQETIVKESA